MKHTYDVIIRNFFRLLCCGVLQEEDALEPMSLYKWRILFSWVCNKRVENVMKSGFETYEKHQSPCITSDVLSLYHESITANGDNVMQLSEMRFSNIWLNRKLKRIRAIERKKEAPASETLNVLNIIIYSFVMALNHGLSFNALLCLAKYIRMNENCIDYVLLKKWLAKLNLDKFAQLQGSILVSFFHFDQSELPFVKKVDTAASQLVLKSLPVAEPIEEKNVKFWQGKLGFVHNNSKILRHSLYYTLSFAHYSPLEAFSNYVHNIALSLANLEE